VRQGQSHRELSHRYIGRSNAKAEWDNSECAGTKHAPHTASRRPLRHPPHMMRHGMRAQVGTEEFHLLWLPKPRLKARAVRSEPSWADWGCGDRRLRPETPLHWAATIRRAKGNRLRKQALRRALSHMPTICCCVAPATLGSWTARSSACRGRLGFAPVQCSRGVRLWLTAEGATEACKQKKGGGDTSANAQAPKGRVHSSAR
jgi:hypothetical protein